MEKTLLIAGKELPDGEMFASGAVTSGRKTLITRLPQPGDDNEGLRTSTNGILSASWNRPSALSARALVLKALNEFGHLDECAIVFDEPHLLQKYGDIASTAENVRIIEELISSYQYIAAEITTRVQKQIRNASQLSAEEKRRLRLVFLHKTNHSLAQGILEKSTDKPSSPFLSAASAAFRAYAENIAASLVESDDITPLLVTCDEGNDMHANDAVLSSWLFGYLDQLDSLRRPLSAKQRLSWTKAGTKTPGGFGFFG